MESAALSPDTAMDLIAKVERLTSEAVTLVGEVLTAPDPESLRAVLQNVADGLMEASAALRAKKVPVGAFARARGAGEAEGYERGFEEGRREGQAGRRSRARHLAVARAAS